MTPTNDVIQRIRKLLALAQSPNEHEASLATSRAQEMLAAYNLEIHQIDSQSTSTTAPESHKRVRHTSTRSGLFEYQRSLWKAVAEANYCWYESIPEIKINTLGVRLVANHRHFLIGSEVNVLGATLMSEYLEEVIKRLCPHKVGKPMFSWREGCAARLVERLNEKRQELENQSREASRRAQEAGGTSTALMTLDNVLENEDDLNYREKWGQIAYERRVSYRHNQETCTCSYCTERRAYWVRIKESDAQAVVVPEKAETDAQRRKREERERRSNDRYWDQRDRKEKRKWASKDMGAYTEGHKKGGDINLDQQVSDGTKGRIKQ